ncbi:transmembrane protein, putative, partial [Bodo saltans]
TTLHSLSYEGATVVNDTHLECATVAITGSSGACAVEPLSLVVSGDFAERSTQRETIVGLLRPVPAQLTSAVTIDSYVGYGSYEAATYVALSGFGFVSSAAARCVLQNSSSVSTSNPSAETIIYETSDVEFVGASSVRCFQPAGLPVSSTPTVFRYSHDGVYFGQSTASFQIVGPTKALIVEVDATTVVAAAVSTLPTIRAYTTDAYGNRRLMLEDFNYSIRCSSLEPQVQIAGVAEVVSFPAPIQLLRAISAGVATLASINVATPVAGTLRLYCFATVDLSLNATVDLVVVAGLPTSIAITSRTTWVAGVLQANRLQPSPSVWLVDAAGNFVRGTSDVVARVMYSAADETSMIRKATEYASSDPDGSYTFENVAIRTVFDAPATMEFSIGDETAQRARTRVLVARCATRAITACGAARATRATGTPGTTCSTCYSKTVNWVVIMIIFAVFIAVIYYLSIHTMPVTCFGEAEVFALQRTESNPFSIVVKIAISHFQMISIIPFSSLAVPSWMTSFISGSSRVRMQPNLSFFACELAGDDISIMQLVLALLPISIGIFVGISAAAALIKTSLSAGMLKVKAEVYRRVAPQGIATVTSQRHHVANVVADNLEHFKSIVRVHDELFGRDDREIFENNDFEEVVLPLGIPPDAMAEVELEVPPEQRDLERGVERRERHERFINMIAVVVVVLLFILYPTVVDTCAGILQCQSIDRGPGEAPGSVVANDPSIDCTTSRYHAAEALGWGMLIAVGVGTPMLCIAAVRLVARTTCRGDMGVAKTVFFFTTGGYRESMWFWECVSLGRKFILVIAVSVVQEDSMSILLATWVIIVAFLLNITVRPWGESVLSVTEAVSLGVVALTFGLCGLLFQPLVAESDAVVTTVYAFIAFVNLIAVGVILWAMLWSMRRTIAILSKRHGLAGRICAVLHTWMQDTESSFKPRALVSELASKQLRLNDVHPRSSTMASVEHLAMSLLNAAEEKRQSYQNPSQYFPMAMSMHHARSMHHHLSPSMAGSSRMMTSDGLTTSRGGGGGAIKAKMKSLRNILLSTNERSTTTSRNEEALDKSFKHRPGTSNRTPGSLEDTHQQPPKLHSSQFDMSIGGRSSPRRQGSSSRVATSDAVEEFIDVQQHTTTTTTTTTTVTVLDRRISMPDHDDAEEIPMQRFDQEAGDFSRHPAVDTLHRSKRDQWVSLRMDRSSRTNSVASGGGLGDLWNDERAHTANPLLPPMSRHKSVVSLAASNGPRSPLFRMAEGLDAAIEGVEDALQSFQTHQHFCAVRLRAAYDRKGPPCTEEELGHHREILDELYTAEMELAVALQRLDFMLSPHSSHGV